MNIYQKMVAIRQAVPYLQKWRTDHSINTFRAHRLYRLSVTC